jgi:membrane protein required for colicin V production
MDFVTAMAVDRSTDEAMPVTILDIIVIVVVLISAILAMVRGFVREILSVASWVAAAAAAYLGYKPLVPLVQPYFQSKTVAVIVSAAAIFFVALIVASYVTMKISDFVIDSRVGAIDRGLGFVFGAVRGLLLLVIALLFFNWLVPTPPPWVTAARSKPLLDNIGERIMAALPPDAEALIMKKLRGNDTGEQNPPAEGAAPPADENPDAAAGAAPAPSDQTYANGQRKGLDQLIQNNDASKSAPAQ